MCSCSEICHDIIRGLSTGLFGGFGVYSMTLAREAYLKYRDKTRVYNYLNQEQTQWEWRTTRAIANNTNLTEDRVRFICSIDTRIDRNENEREVWQIRVES